MPEDIFHTNLSRQVTRMAGWLLLLHQPAGWSVSVFFLISLRGKRHSRAVHTSSGTGHNLPQGHIWFRKQGMSLAFSSPVSPSITAALTSSDPAIMVISLKVPPVRIRLKSCLRAGIAVFTILATGVLLSKTAWYFRQCSRWTVSFEPRSSAVHLL